MKKIFFIFFIALSINLFSQVAINDTGASPNNNAMLDIDISTNNKGILIPRMTSAERNSISGLGISDEGLTVYDTDNDCYFLWDGSMWQQFAMGKGGWSLTGNSGTTVGTNFIGTTDAQDFAIYTNNVERIRVQQDGDVGIGTSSPDVRLHIMASGTDADIRFTEYQNNPYSPMMTSQKARGTSSSPSAVQTGDGLGKFLVYGWDGDSWVNAGSFDFRVTGSVADEQIETSLSFYLQRGSTTAERWRVTNRSQLVPYNSGNSVFIGYQAGNSDDFSANNNVYIGYQAAYSRNQDGGVFIGYQAGYDNNNSENTFIGYRAGVHFTGARSVAIGYRALDGVSSGHFGNSVAIGYRAGLQGFGSGGNAGVAIGAWAGETCTGSYNTIVGEAAGNVSTFTGTRNTLVGYDADMSSGGYSNSCAIGNTSRVTASNQVRIGNNSVTSIGGYANWTNLSDGRFKKDVKEDVVGLDFIMKLQPVTYHLDVESINNYLGISDSLRDNIAEETKYNIVQSGFIAQDVEKAAKSVGYDFSGVDAPKNDNDFYGLRYSEFVVPLVKATQEQQVLIEEMRKQIEILQEENKALVQRLENLENK